MQGNAGVFTSSLGSKGPGVSKPSCGDGAFVRQSPPQHEGPEVTEGPFLPQQPSPLLIPLIPLTAFRVSPWEGKGSGQGGEKFPEAPPGGGVLKGELAAGKGKSPEKVQKGCWMGSALRHCSWGEERHHLDGTGPRVAYLSAGPLGLTGALALSAPRMNACRVHHDRAGVWRVHQLMPLIRETVQWDKGCLSSVGHNMLPFH